MSDKKPIGHPKINDLTPMPFGYREGTPMGELPTRYLLWLKDQPWLKGAVRDYVDAWWDSLTPSKK